jgi:hypothetical protein
VSRIVMRSRDLISKCLPRPQELLHQFSTDLSIFYLKAVVDHSYSEVSEMSMWRYLSRKSWCVLDACLRNVL